MRQILNRRDGKPAEGAYVGRPSFLGNPFPIKRPGGLVQRDIAIRQFRGWFKQRWEEEPGFADKVRRYVGPPSNPLVCWCAPLPCHAEVIREFVDDH